MGDYVPNKGLEKGSNCIYVMTITLERIIIKRDLSFVMEIVKIICKFCSILFLCRMFSGSYGIVNKWICCYGCHHQQNTSRTPALSSKVNAYLRQTNENQTKQILLELGLNQLIFVFTKSTKQFLLRVFHFRGWMYLVGYDGILYIFQL